MCRPARGGFPEHVVMHLRRGQKVALFLDIPLPE